MQNALCPRRQSQIKSPCVLMLALNPSVIGVVGFRDSAERTLWQKPSSSPQRRRSRVVFPRIACFTAEWR